MVSGTGDTVNKTWFLSSWCSLTVRRQVLRLAFYLIRTSAAPLFDDYPSWFYLPFYLVEMRWFIPSTTLSNTWKHLCLCFIYAYLWVTITIYLLAKISQTSVENDPIAKVGVVDIAQLSSQCCLINLCGPGHSFYQSLHPMIRSHLPLQLHLSRPCSLFTLSIAHPACSSLHTLWNFWPP